MDTRSLAGFLTLRRTLILIGVVLLLVMGSCVACRSKQSSVQAQVCCDKLEGYQAVNGVIDAKVDRETARLKSEIEKQAQLIAAGLNAEYERGRLQEELARLQQAQASVANEHRKYQEVVLETATINLRRSVTPDPQTRVASEDCDQYQGTRRHACQSLPAPRR